MCIDRNISHFGVVSTFPFLQQTYTGPAAHHTHNITSQEPPAKPADWVPDRLGDPVKFALIDWQGLAERLKLEDSCHGKHLKVLEIHCCCFLVLRCFHDAPVLNNNHIHSMTDLLLYGGAGHMAVRCWRFSNCEIWKRSTKPFRTEKRSGKRWQIRWCTKLKKVISCYF